ncbi:MAG: phospho-N-acetylmuramoyl-pentapeptide-transferase, partial [Patescibacteria group bacterium]
LVLALFGLSFNTQVLGVVLLTFSYFLIGFTDDYKIIKERNNKGLSPRLKLIFQTFFGSVFMLFVIFQSNLNLSFGSVNIAIHPFFYLIFGVFMLVGFSNATNITDGLDGLCAGTTLFAALIMGFVLKSTHPDLALFMILLSGSSLGFLHHNSNPARVFMGDTGSLAIGGCLAATALVSGEVLPAIIVGIVYILETISVMIQVGYFKYTKKKTGEGKRFFKMAPFHHHLELVGLNEVQINMLAYSITIVCGMLVLTLGL